MKQSEITMGKITERKAEILNRTGSKSFFVFLYLAPTLAIYLLFCVWPYIHAFIISFFERTSYSTKSTFVGFDNYIRLFHDPVIGKALLNNIFLLFALTAITFVLSMFFAAMITHKNYKINKIFQPISFLPYILSVAVVAVIWMFMYNPSFGVINSVLKFFGVEGPVWLGDKDIIMWAITIPLVWTNAGFFTLLFVAAIRNIPGSIFEAASIDGATDFQMFFRITFPLIWNVARIALVFFIVTAFNYSFEFVYATTRGGPNRASELLTTYLYENAFKLSDYGYASAIGVLLFIIVAVIIFVLLHVTKSTEEEKRERRYNKNQKTTS